MLIIRRPFRDGDGKLHRQGDPYPYADQLDPEYRSALIAQGDAEEVDGEDPDSEVKVYSQGSLQKTEKLKDKLARETDRDLTKAEKARGLDKGVGR